MIIDKKFMPVGVQPDAQSLPASVLGIYAYRGVKLKFRSVSYLMALMTRVVYCI